jgi:hypothetical protein
VAHLQLRCRVYVGAVKKPGVGVYREPEDVVPGRPARVRTEEKAQQGTDPKAL